MTSTGVNESETYAYSYSQSEKIRQIMAHKEAKLREEEASENLKNDLNLGILEEADQEEALGGPVTAEATPLSLFSGVSGGGAYSSTISASVGPIVGGPSGGRVPSAIVNGQPVFSNDSSDPFGGVLRGTTPMPGSRNVSAAPMNMYTSSAAPIWPGGSATPLSYR